MIRSLLLALPVALLLCCGAASNAQSCTADCDCTGAPTQSSPGEMMCVGGTCTFQSRSQCAQLPYTCASGQSCNGTICSAKTCR